MSYGCIYSNLAASFSVCNISIPQLLTNAYRGKACHYLIGECY